MDRNTAIKEYKDKFKRVVNNIYISRMCMILIFAVSGFISTYAKDDNIKMTLSGIAMLGMIQGIGLVFISLLEAKSHKKSFVVVLDLLMLNVIYAATYCSIYSWDTLSFNIANKNIIYLDFLYYSFITLTTTGYGDITPVSYLAKFVSASESFVFACIISIVIMNFSKALKNDSTDS